MIVEVMMPDQWSSSFILLIPYSLQESTSPMVLSRFFTRCPLDDPREKAWTEMRMQWLSEQFGVEPLKDAYGEGGVEKMIAARNEQCPLGRMGDAWDVAYAALFLASDEAKYITAVELLVDGGLTAKVA